MSIHTYPAVDFNNEYKRLMSLIPSGLKEALRAHRAVIAGGAITSLFTNNEVNDLDVYFRSWVDMESFIAHMHERKLLNGDVTLNNGAAGPTERLLRYLTEQDGNVDVVFPEVDQDIAEAVDALKNIGMTDKSVMYSFNGKCILQVISFAVFEQGPEAIFKKFDWTINMGSFDFSDESWKISPSFLKDNAQRMLHLNKDTDYPIISLLRVSKYVSRGYKISKKEMIRLAVCIGLLDITCWEDCKKHLSGMYGTNVDDLFSDTEGFSIEALFDKLDNAENDYMDSFSTDQNSQTKYGDALELISVLQRLRKSTGRFYIDKVWAVCDQHRFFLTDKRTSRQVIHIGFSSEDAATWPANFETFSNVVKLYYRKCDAEKSAEHIASLSRGAVLFEASVGNPHLLRENVSRTFLDGGAAHVKLNDLIEIYGELDEHLS